ncbi:hypothetical protein [Motilimonas sp. KMU-193]|uniref:hypothetical protein n=1 Tax=Motilimonas sp. KMU-193 TaxID=3388668 RepID=UPI00396B0BF2
MSDLTCYINKKKGDNGSYLYIESSFSLSFKARFPLVGTHLEILSLDDLVVGEVDGTFIKWFGKEIQKKRKGLLEWYWLLPGQPEKRLAPEGFDKYSLNGEVVASFEEQCHDDRTLCDMFTLKPLPPRFIKLRYDESKLSELTAFSLLLVSISRLFNS